MAERKTWHIGLIRLVAEVRGGRWLCAIIVFGVLIGRFAGGCSKTSTAV